MADIVRGTQVITAERQSDNEVLLTGGFDDVLASLIRIKNDGVLVPMPSQPRDLPDGRVEVRVTLHRIAGAPTAKPTRRKIQWPAASNVILSALGMVMALGVAGVAVWAVIQVVELLMPVLVKILTTAVIIAVVGGGAWLATRPSKHTTAPAQTDPADPIDHPAGEHHAAPAAEKDDGEPRKRSSLLAVFDHLGRPGPDVPPAGAPSHTVTEVAASEPAHVPGPNFFNWLARPSAPSSRPEPVDHPEVVHYMAEETIEVPAKARWFGGSVAEEVRPDTHAERWAAWLEANEHRQTRYVCGSGTGKKSKICATGGAIEMEGGDPTDDDALGFVFEMGRREGYSDKWLKKIMNANDNEGASFKKLARKIRNHG